MSEFPDVIYVFRGGFGEFRVTIDLVKNKEVANAIKYLRADTVKDGRKDIKAEIVKWLENRYINYAISSDPKSLHFSLALEEAIAYIDKEF